MEAAGNAAVTNPPITLNKPSGPLTLQGVIRMAILNYPTIREAQEKINAATAGISLARTAYLPSLTTYAELDRGSDNNIPGMFFPLPGTMTITGRATMPAIYGNYWGSLTGGLLSWEAYDFGLRYEQVNLAKAGQTVAKAGKALTELDVVSQAADAFLRVIASRHVLRAQEAEVARTQVFEKTVAVLVKSGLRPGADDSRALAELALAKTNAIQAQKELALSLAYLAQTLGMAGQPITIANEAFLDTIPNTALPSNLSLTSHPMARLQETQVNLVRSREKVLSKEYFPKINVDMGIMGRGSQLHTDPQVTAGGQGEGLYPTRLNYGVDMNVTFTPTGIFAIRAEERREKANERAEQAKYDDLMQQLTGRYTQAKAAVSAAIAVAQNTPIQLDAAKMTELQVRSRYNAGLATLVDVADAQRLLTQAEIDDSLARLGIWSALLSAITAQGNIGPFVQIIGNNAFSVPSSVPSITPGGSP